MSAKPNVAKPGRKRWIAVEGPCCAGKTTLSRGLLAEMTDVQISHVHCYADHVGGGRFLPRPVPQSVEEDAEAVRTLLDIEASRVAGARAAACDLVLMDRSVYTFMAHRHALHRVTGLACLPNAERAILQSAAPAWPDLVLYLDVPQQTILDRNRGKFPPDSIFIDPLFNAGIRNYFTEIINRGQESIVRLDATLEPEKLVNLAGALIRQLLQASTT